MGAVLILCCSCCFYFVSLLIHVFSLFISTSAVFISFHTIHYPLAQPLPSAFVSFCTILSVYFHPFRICTYYRSSSDFHHPVKCIPAYCEPFRSTRKGIIAEWTPTTAPSVFFYNPLFIVHRPLSSLIVHV